MWRVRMHRLRRVAHAARCAACDHSGTRGAAAPVSDWVRGGDGGACASPSARAASRGRSWRSRGRLRTGGRISLLPGRVPACGVHRLPRSARGLPCLPGFQPVPRNSSCSLGALPSLPVSCTPAWSGQFIRLRFAWTSPVGILS